MAGHDPAQYTRRLRRRRSESVSGYEDHKNHRGIRLFLVRLRRSYRQRTEEENYSGRGRFGPVLAIFGSFFLGELGDKTQLSAITLAASYTQHSFSNAAAVFAGCTLGLILADFIGLIAGLFLRSKMPTGILSKISFLIFAAFGAVSIWDASRLIFVSGPGIILFAGAVYLLFVLVCICLYTAEKKKRF